MKRPYHKNRKLWSAFAGSTALSVAFAVAFAWWNARHIDDDRLCRNQFAYPQHIAQCNAYFHRNNLFANIFTPLSAVAVLCFLGTGVWLLFSFLDEKEKSGRYQP